MRTITESESTPKADGFFMPAEFAPQDRVWMGWPHRTDTWAHGAKPAQKQYAAIARAIAEFTPVTMCANQADYANCKAAFEEDENVTVIEMTTDDAWFRDTAATFVINGKGDKRANHWHFNAYGGLVDGLYFPWDKDEQIALKMAELSGCRRYRPDDMILEGGSITVDGEGTVVVTDQCLLSPGRTCSAVLEEEEDPESIWPKFHKKFEPWSEELREYMAKLGVRTVDELVGRSDLLKVRDNLTGHAAKLDLKNILENPFANSKDKVIFDPKKVYDFELQKTADEKVLLKQMKTALEQKQKRSIEINVSNINRSFGTIFGSEITRKYKDTLEDDTYVVKCNGAGGQSFGAFIPNGLTLELEGDSNDYFGKGLSGGKLVVYPPKGIKYRQDENIVIGNVALYGATSGKAFINGVAGERFAVRNSGAIAVVEGVGDHGCEYMTGGRVVVIGKTGKNFAAGMSGGVAYVLDEDNDLYTRTNKEMVFTEELTNKYDVQELKELIQEHVALTNSVKGKEILDNFGEYLPKFKKVVPYDYHHMLTTIVQMEEKGYNVEQAQIEAFYANLEQQA